jgi:hypothetical protein
MAAMLASATRFARIPELVAPMLELAADDATSYAERLQLLCAAPLVDHRWSAIAQPLLFRNVELSRITAVKRAALFAALGEHRLATAVRKVSCGGSFGGSFAENCESCWHSNAMLADLPQVSHLEICRYPWMRCIPRPSLRQVRLWLATSDDLRYIGTSARQTRHLHIDRFRFVGVNEEPWVPLGALQTFYIGADNTIPRTCFDILLDGSKASLHRLTLGSCYASEISDALLIHLPGKSPLPRFSRLSHLVLDTTCLPRHDPRGRIRLLIDALPVTLVSLALISIDLLADDHLDGLARRLHELPALRWLDLGELDDEDVTTESWNKLELACAAQGVSLTRDNDFPPVSRGACTHAAASAALSDPAEWV